MIKDSEEKQVACTGASRSSRKGRGTASLLPFDAMMELAKHFQEGAEIHAPRNWEKGIPLSWYVDSMFSHLAAIMMGDTDESHERAMAWNAVCFLATWKRIQNGTLPLELDDLPHRIASQPPTSVPHCDRIDTSDAEAAGEAIAQAMMDAADKRRCGSRDLARPRIDIAALDAYVESHPVEKERIMRAISPK